MIAAAGPPEEPTEEPQVPLVLPGGGGSLAQTENAAIRTMLRPRWRKRWKCTREADAIAISATVRNMQVEDGRISNGAVSNYLKMKAQNQADDHKQAPDLHLHAHQHAGLTDARQELLNDPEYLEFVRQKALTDGSQAVPHTNGNGHGGNGNGSHAS